MIEILETLVPMGSTMIGMLGGAKSAGRQMELEYEERQDARTHEKDLEALRLAHDKDLKQDEINIQPTYTDRFIGFKFAGKDWGFKMSTKSESLLMSPVNTCKFLIAGLFSYTYCYIWQFNALNPETVVKTILPEPDSESWSFLWFHSETITHVISQLNLGGLAATTMAQPPLMIVSYIVTNLTYKQLSRR